MGVDGRLEAGQAVITENCWHLTEGQSRRMVCPFCNAEHERSLAVTRADNGALLYKCFRAQCLVSGVIGGVRTPENNKPVNTFEPKYYPGDLEALPEQVLEVLANKYDLAPMESMTQGFLWDVNRGRLVMPLYDIHGGQTGVCAKLMDPAKGGPKSLTYWYEDVPSCSFPRSANGNCNRNEPLFVFEDVLSATKVRRYARTAALIGTGMSTEVVQSLANWTDHLVLVLDRDVWLPRPGSSGNWKPLPLRYKEKYSLYFKNFSTILLPTDDDPKSMSESAIMEYIVLPITEE